MVPKIHSENFKGIELIRPMFLVKERDIISWVRYNELTFLNCACKFTEKVANHEEASKRKQMKKLIEEFRKENKNIDNNIFNAMGNINMSCILGYRDIDGNEHEFVDYYDDLKR
jgi:tRNA(Ile)-lysidine synthase TilS/MesJ